MSNNVFSTAPTAARATGGGMAMPICRRPSFGQPANAILAPMPCSPVR